MADSRNEDLLENVLGASNEYAEPQSRNEAILQNILGEQNELLPPVSRIEKLLLQLKNAMPSGEIEITENGEYDVTSYETATVNVAGGGGISGGYKVTFKVDGDDYYIASCETGGTISEPPTPTKQGYNFSGWKYNNADITFPYTPIADIELTATFTTAIFLLHLNGSVQSMPQTTITTQTAISYNNNGKFGKCLQNASNSVLEYSTTALNKTSSQAKTVEFWVYCPTGMTGGIPVVSASDAIFTVYLSTTAIAILNGSSTILRVEHNRNTNEWFHIAIVIDTTEMRVYVNGTLFGTYNNSYAISSSKIRICSVYSGSKQGIGGLIDELAIFDGAKYTADFTPPTAPY